MGQLFYTPRNQVKVSGIGPKPVGRITALVVDAPMRGQGIGRALVAAAEKTLARAGCGLLEITSHNRLADAHDFYEHLF